MRKLVFTKELLEDYYKNRFVEDLNSYFIIENIDNAEYVKGFKTDLHYAINPPILPRLFSIMHRSTNPVTSSQEEAFLMNDRRKDEEEVLFATLISFMFASEGTVYRLTGARNEKEVASCLSAFGFPWLYPVTRMGLSDFLSEFRDRLSIYIKEEVEAIRDAMTLVMPFMSEKLISFLEKWDNGSFCEKIRFFDTFSEHLSDNISKELTIFYRSFFYEHKGLSCLSFTQREFDEYFKNRFPQQLRHYFNNAKNKGNYCLILDVTYRNNIRWEDGNLGGNIRDNFMFSTFVLFMTLAQQSILEIAKESSEDFHQCTGWPMISSGPGGGPYLHPLYMLEYAGLAPKKYEAPLLSEMVKCYFPYFRQEINTILNGKMKVINDSITGKRFVEAIRNRNRLRIKQYLDNEEKSIQELLTKWPTSSANSLKQLLEEENIPIILEYK